MFQICLICLILTYSCCKKKAKLESKIKNKMSGFVKKVLLFNTSQLQQIRLQNHKEFKVLNPNLFWDDVLKTVLLSHSRVWESL